MTVRIGTGFSCWSIDRIAGHGPDQPWSFPGDMRDWSQSSDATTYYTAPTSQETHVPDSVDDSSIEAHDTPQHIRVLNALHLSDENTPLDLRGLNTFGSLIQEHLPQDRAYNAYSCDNLIWAGYHFRWIRRSLVRTISWIRRSLVRTISWIRRSLVRTI